MIAYLRDETGAMLVTGLEAPVGQLARYEEGKKVTSSDREEQKKKNVLLRTRRKSYDLVMLI